MLVLTSQHWFEAEVELAPEPVPVPCALAKLARPKTVVPKAAARQSFFMDVSSFVHRPFAGARQSDASRYVPPPVCGAGLFALERERRKACPEDQKDPLYARQRGNVETEHKN